MRILSWNINGLRSLKGDLNERLQSLKADIICVQETKVTRDMLEECHAILPDFTSYFAFSRKRSGYSGVATYCATDATPYDAKEGIAGAVSEYDSESQSRVDEEFSAEELKELDAEGRAVVTWHKSEDGKSVAVINVYCPRADPEKRERLLYKMRFYKLLEMRADALLRAGHSVIVVGDVNTSHKQIDHCDPYEDFESQPGRQWMDHFLYMPSLDASATAKSSTKKVIEKQENDDDDDLSEWKARTVNLHGAQFIDAFRHLHPDRKEAFTCWNTKLNCRSTNYGTRIDYVFVDRALSEFLSECDIHPDIEDSDHCPVSAVISVALLPSQKCPQYCTKNFPEFSGRQQKVSQFFTKRKSGENVPSGSTLPPAKRPKQQTMLNFFQSKAATKTVNSETPVVVERQSSLEDVNVEQIEKRVASASAWKTLFKGPPPAPSCRGHNEPAVLRTVKKKGPNSGRQFWSCSRGEGKADDPNARCDFFKWVK